MCHKDKLLIECINCEKKKARDTFQCEKCLKFFCSDRCQWNHRRLYYDCILKKQRSAHPLMFLAHL